LKEHVPYSFEQNVYPAGPIGIDDVGVGVDVETGGVDVGVEVTVPALVVADMLFDCPDVFPAAS
jgi:hypothetical protein